jgi:hypothetical protein
MYFMIMNLQSSKHVEFQCFNIIMNVYITVCILLVDYYRLLIITHRMNNEKP